jgi:hypothetical protein
MTPEQAGTPCVLGAAPAGGLAFRVERLLGKPELFITVLTSATKERRHWTAVHQGRSDGQTIAFPDPPGAAGIGFLYCGTHQRPNYPR